MATELDYMEYANDPDAQEAYSTNGHHTVDFKVTAQLDTAQHKFGVSSLLLDGNSDYLEIADSDDWNFGTGNFTVDIHVRFDAGDTNHSVFIVQDDDGGNYAIFRKGNGVNSGDLQMVFAVGGVQKGNYYVTWNPTAATWYHIRFVRDGIAGYIFINGVEQGVTEAVAFSTNDLGDINAPLFIGGIADWWMTGHLDEVRISKGIARSTTGFSQPTVPYQTDQYTKLLLHLDGVDGAVATIDSSRLEAYSEDTIKEQGSYSLKGIALTGSVNDKLVHLIDPTIDLTDLTQIKFDIRASRTGENIKIGIQDYYTSQYPPVQSDTYVKATTTWAGQFPYNATDPTKSVTGGWGDNGWVSTEVSGENQRFHIDLGSAKIITRIYYENFHTGGGITERGVQNFTFWGSNIGGGSFDDLVWGNDGGWTELTVDNNNKFDRHSSTDEADPKYIIVDNDVAYRYYAIKCVDNYGNFDYIGFRRIELQTGTTTGHIANISSVNTWQTETWDISGVSNADKDAISQIIITIVNADADNIFYIDNIYAEEAPAAVDNAIFMGCAF